MAGARVFGTPETLKNLGRLATFGMEEVPLDSLIVVTRSDLEKLGSVTPFRLDDSGYAQWQIINSGLSRIFDSVARQGGLTPEQRAYLNIPSLPAIVQSPQAIIGQIEKTKLSLSQGIVNGIYEGVENFAYGADSDGDGKNDFGVVVLQDFDQSFAHHWQAGSSDFGQSPLMGEQEALAMTWWHEIGHTVSSVHSDENHHKVPVVMGEIVADNFAIQMFEKAQANGFEFDPQTPERHRDNRLLTTLTMQGTGMTFLPDFNGIRYDNYDENIASHATHFALGDKTSTEIMQDMQAMMRVKEGVNTLLGLEKLKDQQSLASFFPNGKVPLIGVDMNDLKENPAKYGELIANNDNKRALAALEVLSTSETYKFMRTPATDDYINTVFRQLKEGGYNPSDDEAYVMRRERLAAVVKDLDDKIPSFQRAQPSPAFISAPKLE